VMFYFRSSVRRYFSFLVMTEPAYGDMALRRLQGVHAWLDVTEYS
jgi:hypothetical protein